MLRNAAKRLRSGLGTKEGKLKAFIFGCGLFLISIIITLVSLELTNTPQFCQSCHEMRPEYVTWKASSHSQLSCVDCHIGPGVENLLNHKAKSFKQLYIHFAGKVKPPIEVAMPIRDEVCEQCHTANRIATPSGDLKIPHKSHKDNGVPCVKCHSSVAHANIGKVENGYTADGNWDKWIEPVGQIFMRADFLKFSMEECIACHKKEETGPSPSDCRACHNKLVKPDSHAEPKFKTSHGFLAEQDITQCNKCHRITIAPKDPRVPVNDLVVMYARKNTFCADCHANSKTPPPSHTISWKRTHVVSATDNRSGCLVCHDEGKPTKGSKATKTYCYQCHKTNIHYNVIELGIHTNGPSVNGSVEPVQYPCLTCHSSSTCRKCHYIPAANDPLDPKYLNRVRPRPKNSPGLPDYDPDSPSGNRPGRYGPPSGSTGDGIDDENSPSGGDGYSSPGSYNRPPAETG